MRPFSREFSTALPILALAALTSLPLSGCDNPSYANQLGNGNAPEGVASANGDKAKFVPSFLQELRRSTPLQNGLPVEMEVHSRKQVEGTNRTTPDFVNTTLGTINLERPGYYGLEFDNLEIGIRPPVYSPKGEMVLGTGFSNTSVVLRDDRNIEDPMAFRMTLDFGAAEVFAKGYKVAPNLARHTLLALKINNWSEFFIHNPQDKSELITLAAFAPDGSVITFIDNITAKTTGDSNDITNRVFMEKLVISRIGKDIMIATGKNSSATQSLHLDGRYEIYDPREIQVKASYADSRFFADRITTLN